MYEYNEDIELILEIIDLQSLNESISNRLLHIKEKIERGDNFHHILEEIIFIQKEFEKKTKSLVIKTALKNKKEK
jgi:hypothetical protein